VAESSAVQLTFTNAASSSTPPSASFHAGDYVWLMNEDKACGTRPVVGNAFATGYALVTGQTFTYQFGFSNPGFFRPCVERGSIVMDYSNIEVFVTNVAVKDTNDNANPVLIKPATAAEVVQLKVTGANSIKTGDILRFVVDSTTCEDTTALPATTSSYVVYDSAVSAYDFTFGDVPASDKPLRLCVLRHLQIASASVVGSATTNTTLTLDLDFVSVTLASVDVITSTVFNQRTQAVQVQIDSGIDVGDIMFFATTCPTSVPAQGTSVATIGQTVTSISSGIVELPFNFEQITPTASNVLLKLCVQRQSNNAIVDFGDSLRVLDKTTKILSAGLVRRSAVAVLTVTYTTGELLTDTHLLSFVDAQSTCPSTDATLSVGVNATASTVLTSGIDVNSNTNIFANIRFANRLMRLCSYHPNTGALVAEYVNLGVVVSDITIMDSDSSTTDTVGCVQNAVSQTISFSQSSSLVFESTSKLFFKKQEASDEACGSAPDVSSAVSSSATAMAFNSQSSSSTATFSLDFDFSSAKADLQVYRLCVELTDGTVLDFAPLGVRVSDLVLQSYVSGTTGAAAVKPIPQQTLSLTYGNDATAEISNAQVWFIDDSSSYVTCACSDLGVCSGTTFASTAKVTVGTSMQFNFTQFDGSVPATMCLKPNGAVAYTLSCLTVAFAVVPNPSSVPSNDGQLIALGYDGGSLTPGDHVMFVHEDYACESVTSFATARTNNQAAYTNVALVGIDPATPLSFDFSGLQTTGNTPEAYLCVNSTATGEVYSLKSSKVAINKEVVGLAGDPHVRSATGEWLDFYGEAGVYTLLDGNIQANARFAYAVRDNFMIWHPKVMRPGTLVEEVGIQLKNEQASLRLGVQGGGIVSVRTGHKLTEFWAASEDHELRIGDYTVTWSKCSTSCEAQMPWGMHQRSNSLTVEGRGEFLQVFIARSGGYRFVDVEAMPHHQSSGLLSDALVSPAALAARLVRGGESTYKSTLQLP